MNRLTLLSLGTLVALLAVLFTACGNDDEPTDPDKPDTPGNVETGRKDLLYGVWGAAGNKYYEFAENGVCKVYYGMGTFTYDEKSGILSMTLMEGGYPSVFDLKVVALTRSVICLEIADEEGKYTLYLSRITDNDSDAIGSISDLYGKKLLAMGVMTLDNEATVMSITLKSKDKAVWTVNGTSQTFDYRYDGSARQLILSIYGQEVQTFTVTRLTEDAIFLQYADGETVIEYRAM